MHTHCFLARQSVRWLACQTAAGVLWAVARTGCRGTWCSRPSGSASGPSADEERRFSQTKCLVDPPQPLSSSANELSYNVLAVCERRRQRRHTHTCHEKNALLTGGSDLRTPAAALPVTAGTTPSELAGRSPCEIVGGSSGVGRDADGGSDRSPIAAATRFCSAASLCSEEAARWPVTPAFATPLKSPPDAQQCGCT